MTTDRMPNPTHMGSLTWNTTSPPVQRSSDVIDEALRAIQEHEKRVLYGEKGPTLAEKLSNTAQKPVITTQDVVEFFRTTKVKFQVHVIEQQGKMVLCVDQPSAQGTMPVRVVSFIIDKEDMSYLAGQVLSTFRSVICAEEQALLNEQTQLRQRLDQITRLLETTHRRQEIATAQEAEVNQALERSETIKRRLAL